MKLYKFAVLLLALVLSACAPAAPASPEAQNPSASGGSQTESGKWCSGVTLRFFAGGDEAIPLLRSCCEARKPPRQTWGQRWIMSSPAGIRKK